MTLSTSIKWVKHILAMQLNARENRWRRLQMRSTPTAALCAVGYERNATKYQPISLYWLAGWLIDQVPMCDLINNGTPRDNDNAPRMAPSDWPQAVFLAQKTVSTVAMPWTTLFSKFVSKIAILTHNERQACCRVTYRALVVSQSRLKPL